MTSQRVPLSHDKEHHELALKAYEKCVEREEALKDWMEIKLMKQVKDIMDRKETIRILAYEPNDIALRFLGHITDYRNHNNVDCVIQYKVLSSNNSCFRELATQLQDTNNLFFDWSDSTSSSYFEKLNIKENNISKFDIVHFFNGFRPLNSTQTIQDTYDNLLEEDGILAAVGEDKHSFWYKLMQFVSSHKIEHDYFTSSNKIPDSCFLPSWIAQARGKGWMYQSYVRDYNFHVSPLYTTWDNDSNYLLDFLFQIKNARRTISEEILQKFMKFIDEGKIDIDGKKIFRNKFGALLIIKE